MYVKFEKPRGIRDFIRAFYTHKSSNAYCLNPLETYFDPECTKLHCLRSYRSFDDLYALIKTYYPSVTPKRTIHFLLTTKLTLPGGGEAKPHLGTCSTMKRIRFIPYREFNWIEDALTKKMEESEFTWQELLDKVGIHSHKDLLEYVKNSK